MIYCRYILFGTYSTCMCTFNMLMCSLIHTHTLETHLNTHTHTCEETNIMLIHPTCTFLESVTISVRCRALYRKKVNVIKAWRAMLMSSCLSATGLIHSQNSRMSLQPYLELVENDRPYKCAFCNKAYKKSSHLKQHVRYGMPPD